MVQEIEVYALIDGLVANSRKYRRMVSGFHYGYLCGLLIYTESIIGGIGRQETVSPQEVLWIGRYGSPSLGGFRCHNQRPRRSEKGQSCPSRFILSNALPPHGGRCQEKTHSQNQKPHSLHRPYPPHLFLSLLGLPQNHRIAPWLQGIPSIPCPQA